MKVAIAGASGFVGRALMEHILRETDWSVIAISRSLPHNQNPRVEWRQADLFSLLEVTKALAGADKAFYLVHSMLPSAQLDQGSFEDYDLLLADNFARACDKNRVQHVVYLGGILPSVMPLSPHLRSRHEVEEVFRNRTFSVTNLRAGLILGEGGSSFNIMYNLIRRLPVLVCPSWSMNPMTPVDLADVVRALVETAASDEFTGRDFEIGGPDTHTYFDLLRICARVMGKRRLFIPIPIAITGFSRLWVRLFSGASKELVYPLLDSLKTPMQLNESARFPLRLPPKSYEKSLNVILRSPQQIRYQAPRYQRHFVRSVQRIRTPAGTSAKTAAGEYARWLPIFLWPLVLVTVDGPVVSFALFTRRLTLLELTYSVERSDVDRQLFYITGGILARRHDKGRLEFREVLGGRYLIVAIHDFYPALPWIIYRYTQALLHLWVMRNFARHIG